MSQKSAIKVKNLVKSFGKDENLVKVIENASFEIQKGEVVALIAPSGAGKTTLLLMIGCVLEPQVVRSGWGKRWYIKTNGSQKIPAEYEERR